MRCSFRGLTSLIIVAVAAACQPEEVERPYDTLLTCRDPNAVPIDTLEQAIARLDADEDGRLTDRDLRPREARSVIRLDGVHNATGQVSEPGVSVHGDFEPLAYFNPWVERPTWQVEMALECVPVATVSLLFQTPGERLEPGSHPVFSMSVAVWTHEVGTRRDMAHRPDVVGSVRITEVSDSGISGWFEGRATDTLHTPPDEELPTGQSLTIEAFAFRDVPLAEI